MTEEFLDFNTECNSYWEAKEKYRDSLDVWEIDIEAKKKKILSALKIKYPEVLCRITLGRQRMYDYGDRYHQTHYEFTHPLITHPETVRTEDVEDIKDGTGLIRLKIYHLTRSSANTLRISFLIKSKFPQEDILSANYEDFLSFYVKKEV